MVRISIGQGQQEEDDAGAGVGQDVRERPRQPPKYAVILLNDDYTTMDFVIEVLKRYFNKSEAEAAQIMLRIHHAGRGTAGVYSRDIAETKAYQVQQLAKSRGYPLRCDVEPSG